MTHQSHSRAHTQENWKHGYVETYTRTVQKDKTLDNGELVNKKFRH